MAVTVAGSLAFTGLWRHSPFYIEVSWDVLHHAIQANKTTSLYLPQLQKIGTMSRRWLREHMCDNRVVTLDHQSVLGTKRIKAHHFSCVKGFKILWRQHLTSVFCRHERSWKPRFSLGENCEKLGTHRFKRVSLRSWELVPVTLVLKTSWPCFLATPQEVIIGSFYSQRRMMSIS